MNGAVVLAVLVEVENTVAGKGFSEITEDQIWRALSLLESIHAALLRMHLGDQPHGGKNTACD